MAEATIEYIDTVGVMETFADHCERVLFDGQTLRVEVAVTRYSAPPRDGKSPKARRTAVSRLVLTPQAALQLHAQLNQVVGGLEKKGLVRKREQKSVTSQ